MSVLDQVDAEEKRRELVRAVRGRVDVARALCVRLQRELGALELNPRKNQLAIERFRLELERARLELREASRALVRC